MKFLPIITFATGITAVAVRAKLDYIAGTAGARYCDKRKHPMMIDFEHIDIEPRVAVPGQNITVTGTGKAPGIIGEGAKFQPTFKKGSSWIPFPKGDLCALPGMTCGVSAGGVLNFFYDLKVPESARTGKWKYEVIVEAPNPAGEVQGMKQLGCVRGKVKVRKN